MPTPPNSLAGIDLLTGLTPAEIAEIEASIHIRAFQAEQIVVAYQDPTQDVFFLLDGRFRVTIFDADGREVAFRDLGPGDSFGELSAIDGQARSASVLALTHAVVGSLTAREFNGLLRRYPSVMERTLLKLTRLVRSLSERIIEFNAPVPVRIAKELIRLSEGRMINQRVARLKPAPKHADIASRLNTHREAVSRTMSQLGRLAIVQRGQGELLITDTRRLADWALHFKEH
jgi:CRP-like cAMP-binding protein